MVAMLPDYVSLRVVRDEFGVVLVVQKFDARERETPPRLHVMSPIGKTFRRDQYGRHYPATTAPFTKLTFPKEADEPYFKSPIASACRGSSYGICMLSVKDRIADITRSDLANDLHNCDRLFKAFTCPATAITLS